MAFKRQVVGSSSNRQAPQLFGQGFPTFPGFTTYVYATLLMMMAVLLLVTDVQCKIGSFSVPNNCKKFLEDPLDRSYAAIGDAEFRIGNESLYDKQKDASHIGIVHKYIKKVEAAQLELAALYYDTKEKDYYSDANGKCRVPDPKEVTSKEATLLAACDKLDPQKKGLYQKLDDHVRGWSTSYVAGAGLVGMGLSFFGGTVWGKSQADSLTPASPPTVSNDQISTILSTTIGKSSSFTVTIVLLLAALVAGAVLYFVLMDKSDSGDDSAEGSGKDVEAGKTAGKNGKTTTSAKKVADGGATSAGTTATTPSSTPTTTGTTSNVTSAKPKTADTLMKPPLSTKKSPTPGGGAKSTKSAKAGGTPSTTPTPK